MFQKGTKFRVKFVIKQLTKTSYGLNNKHSYCIFFKRGMRKKNQNRTKFLKPSSDKKSVNLLSWNEKYEIEVSMFHDSKKTKFRFKKLDFVFEEKDQRKKNTKFSLKGALDLSQLCEFRGDFAKQNVTCELFGTVTSGSGKKKKKESHQASLALEVSLFRLDNVSKKDKKKKKSNKADTETDISEEEDTVPDAVPQKKSPVGKKMSSAKKNVGDESDGEWEYFSGESEGESEGEGEWEYYTGSSEEEDTPQKSAKPKVVPAVQAAGVSKTAKSEPEKKGAGAGDVKLKEIVEKLENDKVVLQNLVDSHQEEMSRVEMEKSKKIELCATAEKERDLLKEKNKLLVAMVSKERVAQENTAKKVRGLEEKIVITQKQIEALQKTEKMYKDTEMKNHELTLQVEEMAKRDEKYKILEKEKEELLETIERLGEQKSMEGNLVEIMDKTVRDLKNNHSREIETIQMTIDKNKETIEGLLVVKNELVGKLKGHEVKNEQLVEENESLIGKNRVLDENMIKGREEMAKMVSAMKVQQDEMKKIIIKVDEVEEQNRILNEMETSNAKKSQKRSELSGKRFSKLTEEHSREIKAIRVEHKRVIDQLLLEKEKEIGTIRENLKTELEKIENEKEEEIEKISRDKNRALTGFKEEKLNEIRTENAKKVGEITLKYTQEIENLRNSSQLTLEETKKEHQKQSEMISLQNKHEMQKITEEGHEKLAKLQLEKQREIESLQAVNDRKMREITEQKNNDIKNAQTKIANLSSQIEKERHEKEQTKKELQNVVSQLGDGNKVQTERIESLEKKVDEKQRAYDIMMEKLVTAQETHETLQQTIMDLKQKSVRGTDENKKISELLEEKDAEIQEFDRRIKEQKIVIEGQNREIRERKSENEEKNNQMDAVKKELVNMEMKMADAIEMNKREHEMKIRVERDRSRSLNEEMGNVEREREAMAATMKKLQTINAELSVNVQDEKNNLEKSMKMVEEIQERAARSLEELQVKSVGFKQQYQEAQDEIIQKDTEMEELVSQLNSAMEYRSKAKTLERKIAEKEQDNHELAAKLKEMGDNMKEKVFKISDSNEDLRRKNEELSSVIKSRDNELAEGIAANKELMDQFDEFKGKFEILKKVIEQVRQEKESDKLSYTTKINQLNEEIKGVNERLQLEREKAEQSEVQKVKTLEEHIEKNEKRIEQLREEKNELEKGMNEKILQMSELKEIVKKNVKDDTKKDVKFEQLRQEKQKLEKDVLELMKNLKKEQMTTDDNHDETERVKLDLNNSKMRIQTMESKQQHMEKLNTDLRKMNEEMKKSIEKYGEFLSEYETMKTENSKLKEIVDNKDAETKEKIDFYKTTVKKLTKQTEKVVAEQLKNVEQVEGIQNLEKLELQNTIKDLEIDKERETGKVVELEKRIKDMSVTEEEILNNLRGKIQHLEEKFQVEKKKYVDTIEIQNEEMEKYKENIVSLEQDLQFWTVSNRKSKKQKDNKMIQTVAELRKKLHAANEKIRKMSSSLSKVQRSDDSTHSTLKAKIQENLTLKADLREKKKKLDGYKKRVTTMNDSLEDNTKQVKNLEMLVKTQNDKIEHLMKARRKEERKKKTKTPRRRLGKKSPTSVGKATPTSSQGHMKNQIQKFVMRIDELDKDNHTLREKARDLQQQTKLYEEIERKLMAEVKSVKRKNRELQEFHTRTQDKYVAKVKEKIEEIAVLKEDLLKENQNKVVFFAPLMEIERGIADIEDHLNEIDAPKESDEKVGKDLSSKKKVELIDHVKTLLRDSRVRNFQHFAINQCIVYYRSTSPVYNENIPNFTRVLKRMISQYQKDKDFSIRLFSSFEYVFKVCTAELHLFFLNLATYLFNIFKFTTLNSKKFNLEITKIPFKKDATATFELHDFEAESVVNTLFRMLGRSYLMYFNNFITGLKGILNKVLVMGNNIERSSLELINNIKQEYMRLSDNHVHPRIIFHFFVNVCTFIDIHMFNTLVLKKKQLFVSSIMKLKLNLTGLENFLRSQFGRRSFFKFTRQLCDVCTIGAANFSQDKNARMAICPDLNDLQIRAISEKLNMELDEKSTGPKLEGKFKIDSSDLGKYLVKDEIVLSSYDVDGEEIERYLFDFERRDEFLKLYDVEQTEIPEVFLNCDEELSQIFK